jgi:hypothetical protein
MSRRNRAKSYPPLAGGCHNTSADHGDERLLKVGSALRLTYCVLTLSAPGLWPGPQTLIAALRIVCRQSLGFSFTAEPSDVLYAEIPFAVAAMGFPFASKSERPICCSQTCSVRQLPLALRTRAILSLGIEA